MLETVPKPVQASDLRYALTVMEECSHLGLDDEYARRLRAILQRRIEGAEELRSCSTAQPIQFSVSTGRE